MLNNSLELPDCIYKTRPELIRPGGPTPNETLNLSNLDDQKFLRFSIKYVYVFRKSVGSETALRRSLSKALVEFYLLAGRVRRRVGGDDRKLQVECNGEGAVFAEASMDLSCDEFFEFAEKPNRSLMRKLLYRVEATDFLEIPPLIIQVTNLRCGGMILCTAINHCICDGIATSHFLHAWAHIHQSSSSPIPPFHSRHVLKSRSPPQVTFSHPGFTKIAPSNVLNPQTAPNIFNFLQSQPLVPSSLTFSSSQILHLKRHCYPSLKCTTFEVLAAHTWRSWVKSLGLPPSFQVKLLFSTNIRNKMQPEMPQGYFGNGFVLACAEAKVKEVNILNLHHGVKLVQHAKSTVTNDYVRSIIDLLVENNMTTDMSASLVISQWSKLGLEELDFGEGKPLQMGTLYSDIYCVFLPEARDLDAVRVLISMPQSIVDKFEFYMTQLDGIVENEDAKNHYGVDNFKMVSVLLEQFVIVYGYNFSFANYNNVE